MKRLIGAASGVAFTLPGGDLNDTNSVNVLDYSVMKTYYNKQYSEPLGVNYDPASSAADINGDGQVQLLDYSLLKANWFKLGNPR